MAAAGLYVVLVVSCSVLYSPVAKVVLPKFNADDTVSSQTSSSELPLSVDVGVTIPGTEGITKFNYQTYIRALFNFAVNILGPVLTIMMIMYGGYMYLFSAGDDAKIKEGTSIIIGSSIGYAILFIAKFLLNILVGPGGGGDGL